MQQLVVKLTPCQVNLKDGRELLGELQCIDRQQNLVLSQTFELLRDRYGCRKLQANLSCTWTSPVEISQGPKLVMDISAGNFTFAARFLCPTALVLNWTRSGAILEQKRVGAVLVPLEHRKTCEVEVDSYIAARACHLYQRHRGGTHCHASWLPNLQELCLLALCQICAKQLL